MDQPASLLRPGRPAGRGLRRRRPRAAGEAATVDIKRSGARFPHRQVRHRPVDRVRPALRASFYCWDPGLVPAEQIIRCQDFIQETNGKP